MPTLAAAPYTVLPGCSDSDACSDVRLCAEGVSLPAATSGSGRLFAAEIAEGALYCAEGLRCSEALACGTDTGGGRVPMVAATSGTGQLFPARVVGVALYCAEGLACTETLACGTDTGDAGPVPMVPA